MVLMHRELTDKIIGIYYDVYNELGFGFLERVYENAMTLELKARGISHVAQSPINVYYKSQIVGEYFADIIVENAVIVELKAQEQLMQAHEAQLINYLRATEIRIGLLFNFGKKPEFVRKVV